MKIRSLLSLTPAALGLVALASSASAAPVTWNGQGTNNSLTNPANYSGNPPINPGDDLTFATATVGPQTTASVTADYTARTLLFNGNNFVTSIGGANTLTVNVNNASTTNGVTNNDSATVAINSPFAVSNSLAGSTNIIPNNADLSFGGSFNVGTATNFLVNSGRTLTVSGALTGSGALVAQRFAGAGTATVILDGSAANTFTGTLQVNANTILALGKTAGTNAIANTSVTVAGGRLRLDASNQIANTTNLSLGNSGFFDLTGSSETLGDLQINTGVQTITFGAGTEALAFADSSARTWSGTLGINGFTVGTDTLRFGTTAGGLSPAQLSAINFGGTAAMIDSSGFVTPVPEPATTALLLGAAVVLFCVRRRAARQ